MRHYDHIDLRVPRLTDVVAFYETLLPALGFSRRVSVEGWLQFEAANGAATEFFGIPRTVRQLSSSASQNLLVTPPTKTEWRSGRKALRRWIGLRKSRHAPVLATSKARWIMNRVTTRSSSRIHAATAWKSVIAGAHERLLRMSRIARFIRRRNEKSMNRPAIPHAGGIACRDDQMKGEKNDKPQDRNT
jgi:hypothetical protein